MEEILNEPVPGTLHDDMAWHGWNVAGQELPFKKYTCARCGNRVASCHGFVNEKSRIQIYICTCGKPVIFDGPDQIPANRPGQHVQHLPQPVEHLWNEMRDCHAAGAYRAVAMCARLMLMHVATTSIQGLALGESFAVYAERLIDEGLVPKNLAHRLDDLRGKGNEVNHRSLESPGQQWSAKAVEFVQYVLQSVYEFAGPDTPP